MNKRQRKKQARRHQRDTDLFIGRMANPKTLAKMSEAVAGFIRRQLSRPVSFVSMVLILDRELEAPMKPCAVSGVVHLSSLIPKPNVAQVDFPRALLCAPNDDLSQADSPLTNDAVTCMTCLARATRHG